MRRFSFAIVFTLCACGPSRPPESPEPRPLAETTDDRANVATEETEPLAQQEPSPPVARLGPTQVQVQWSNVQRTATCFFFSGPERLGRDDQLGSSAQWVVEGERVTLTFDQRATFRGTLSGSRLDLHRRSSHDFGSKWAVEERISGTIVNGSFQGSYGYTECDTRRRETCPGECTISADVRIEIPDSRSLHSERLLLALLAGANFMGKRNERLDWE
jgi:hypothetical protein